MSSDFEEVGNDGMDSKTTENETVGTDAEIASSFQTDVMEAASPSVIQSKVTNEEATTSGVNVEYAVIKLQGSIMAYMPVKVVRVSSDEQFA